MLQNFLVGMNAAYKGLVCGVVSGRGFHPALYSEWLLLMVVLVHHSGAVKLSRAAYPGMVSRPWSAFRQQSAGKVLLWLLLSLTLQKKRKEVLRNPTKKHKCHGFEAHALHGISIIFMLKENRQL